MKKIKRKTNLKFTQKRHLLPILILYILILACAALPAVYMSNIYGYLPVLLVLSAVVVSFAYGLLLQRCISYMEMCNLKFMKEYAVNLLLR